MYAICTLRTMSEWFHPFQSGMQSQPFVTCGAQCSPWSRGDEHQGWSYRTSHRRFTTLHLGCSRPTPGCDLPRTMCFVVTPDSRLAVPRARSILYGKSSGGIFGETVRPLTNGNFQPHPFYYPSLPLGLPSVEREVLPQKVSTIPSSYCPPDIIDWHGRGIF